VITSNITNDIQIPHEPDTTITIRMLSHGALKKARDNRLRDLAQMIGGVDFGSITRADRGEERAEADPLAGYDITTVLHKGIKSWTYPEKCTPENIDELDDVTAEYVAKKIIDLSRRSVAEGEDSGER